MSTSIKRILSWAAGVAGLLLIPLIAMQLTDEVMWDITDFTLMGSILLILGMGYELVVRGSNSLVYQAAFAIGVFGAFLLFWVNAAVGIIGSEGQLANLLFAAVFVVGAIGALWSRLKPKGMAITMFIAGGVQLLVPAIALLIWPPPVISWSPGILGVFFLAGFFAFLFTISGALFRRAATTI